MLIGSHGARPRQYNTATDFGPFSFRTISLHPGSVDNADFVRMHMVIHELKAVLRIKSSSRTEFINPGKYVNGDVGCAPTVREDEDGLHPMFGFFRAVGASVSEALDIKDVVVKCHHFFSRCEPILREDEWIVCGSIDVNEFGGRHGEVVR